MTENPRVGGSIPSLGSLNFQPLIFALKSNLSICSFSVQLIAISARRYGLFFIQNFL
jgi:hypothetical protein